MQYLIRHWPRDKSWEIQQKETDEPTYSVIKLKGNRLKRDVETGTYITLDEYRIYIPCIFDPESDAALALRTAEYYILKFIREENEA